MTKGVLEVASAPDFLPPWVTLDADNASFFSAYGTSVFMATQAEEGASNLTLDRSRPQPSLIAPDRTVDPPLAAASVSVAALAQPELGRWRPQPTGFRFIEADPYEQDL